jgi:proteasome lid subunit RPN8/RPN11
MHVFDKDQYRSTLREACNSAHGSDGRELCGLIVSTGRHLSFVRTRNTLRRPGGFALSRLDVRKIVGAARVLGQEVVGTFHSHPRGLAEPGHSDIEHAVDGSLMFIFDCLGRTGRLWRIKGGKARSLEFDFLKGNRDT